MKGDFLRRLERLEERVGSGDCTCPLGEGARIVVAKSGEEAAAASAVFDGCPVRHKEAGIVVRIRSLDEMIAERERLEAVPGTREYQEAMRRAECSRAWGCA